MKIYHAHGYVIASDNLVSGDEVWNRDSAFSEVFFDFEKARKYLLEKFESLLAYIYRHDNLFKNEPIQERDIKNATPTWRREYIDEYIDYTLVISELTPEYAPTNYKIDFSNPQKIDWYLRYTGEVRTRYFVFGDEEYECRESDLLPEAGTKFKVGDLVEYTDWEFKRDYPWIYVVLTPPQKPKDQNTPWENEYEVVCIEGDNRLINYGRVGRETVHEGDLRLVDSESLERRSCGEPLLTLQRVIKGEADISPELREDILHGRVLFNSAPSWRDYPKLYKK